MPRKTKASPERTQIGPLLEQLAVHLAQAALGTDAEGKPISFDQKTDAFKALSNYYAMQNKLGPANTKGSFNGYQDSLQDLGRGRDTRPIAVERGAEPDY